MDRRSAQQRIARIRAFRAELAELEREGVLALSETERAAVGTHHAALTATYEREFDIDATADTEKLSLGLKIASAFGALALSLAVYFFFEQFWGRLPLTAQVPLLAAAPLAAVALAELASRRERTLYVTSIFCAVAIAAFVVNLAALPGLLSLRSSPVSLALFAAFAGLLAHRYRLRLPLFFAVVFGVSFAAMAPRWIAGFDWENLYERPELLLAAALGAGWLSIRQPPDFAAVYRCVCALGLLLAFVALASSGGLSFLPMDSSVIEGIYTVAGLTIAAYGIGLGIRREWLEVTILSTAGFVLVLFMKMYDWLWNVLPPYLFFLLIGAISLALIVLFRRVRGRLRERTA